MEIAIHDVCTNILYNESVRASTKCRTCCGDRMNLRQVMDLLRRFYAAMYAHPWNCTGCMARSAYPHRRELGIDHVEAWGIGATHALVNIIEKHGVTHMRVDYSDIIHKLKRPFINALRRTTCSVIVNIDMSILCDNEWNMLRCVLDRLGCKRVHFGAIWDRDNVAALAEIYTEAYDRAHEINRARFENDVARALMYYHGYFACEFTAKCVESYAARASRRRSKRVRYLP